MSKFIPWSFSSLDMFVSCPKKFKHIKILKDSREEEESEALVWGNRVHKALENYLRDGVPLPSGFEAFQDYAARLKAIEGEKHIELEAAVTADMTPTSFFAKDVYSRGKIDYLVVNGNRAVVIDHKTGKKKHTRQLALMALYVFLLFPQVDEVQSMFCFVPGGDFIRERWLRENINQIFDLFAADIQAYKRALEEDVFVARPSGLCNGWCPVKSCEHWRPKRK